tara:strand:+ start:2295 stop:2549 length:255 start_codon:yes stop_codon:yes gene_type:complete
MPLRFKTTLGGPQEEISNDAEALSLVALLPQIVEMVPDKTAWQLKGAEVLHHGSGSVCTTQSALKLPLGAKGGTVIVWRDVTVA